MRYLSRLLLDPAEPAVLRLLAEPTPLHRAVYDGFDRAERSDARVLFRVEPEREAVTRRAVILVQSETKPRGWRWPYDEPKPLDPGEWGLEPARRLRFRLRANPTKREPAGGELREGKPIDGPRRGILGEEAQRAWLLRKLSDAGAELLDCLVIDEGLFEDQAAPRRQFQSVRFDGHLRVNNAEALTVAVLDGLGTGRGFGFGLLSLAPG